MPVYFRRVQENHFWKSDRILNIFTKAKSQKKHALEVMWFGSCDSSKGELIREL